MRYKARLLEPNDTDPWHALRIEGARDFPLAFIATEEETKAASRDQVAGMLAQGVVWGVFAEKTLVGFCVYRPKTLERTRHRAEIGPFYITPAHHGKGAAAELMEAVADEAKKNDVEQLELFVDTENERAQGFFKKAGFEWISTVPLGVRIDGEDRVDCIFIRDLRL